VLWSVNVKTPFHPVATSPKIWPCGASGLILAWFPINSEPRGHSTPGITGLSNQQLSGIKLVSTRPSWCRVAIKHYCRYRYSSVCLHGMLLLQLSRARLEVCRWGS
jgi:hypothetical protein